jgi:hypothetical protein
MPRFARASTLFAVTLFAGVFSPALPAQIVVQPAAVVLQSAKVQAAQQKKAVFLLFCASWVKPCGFLNTFLTDKQMHPIIDKYFVPGTVHVNEEGGKGGSADYDSLGGDSMMGRFGGTTKAGSKVSLPFYAFVDADGNLIVNSIDAMKEGPGDANIGYPSNPGQVAWFISMLKKAAPTITPEESEAVENWLKKHDPASMAPPGRGGRGR